MKRNKLTGWAAVTAAAVVMAAPLSASSAGPIVSQAEAEALEVRIGGEGGSSGTVRATNDGTGETKTGEVTPPIGLLADQDVLDIGVLVQDAEATLQGRDGVSRACSGVAGNGGQTATVGESNCITPGDPVGISIANLDLTGSVVFTPGSALEGLNGITQPIIDQLAGPLTQAISEGLEPFGATGLEGTLGAVEARCTARPGEAEGSANIVDTALTLSIGGTSTPLVNFPANPPPNTKVLTNLDVVLNTIIDALRVDLNTTLDAQLAPLQAIIDPIQEQLVNQVIAQIAPQLAPLEENILDITLNKQTKTNGKIEVIAIDLKLLPAASQFGQPPLVEAEIARVACGPNGRADGPGGPDGPDGPNGPGGPDGPGGPGLPEVPTAVDSGVAGTGLGLWTLLGMALVTAAGVVGARRVLARG